MREERFLKSRRIIGGRERKRERVCVCVTVKWKAFRYATYVVACDGMIHNFIEILSKCKGSALKSTEFFTVVFWVSEVKEKITFHFENQMKINYSLTASMQLTVLQLLFVCHCFWWTVQP